MRRLRDSSGLVTAELAVLLPALVLLLVLAVRAVGVGLASLQCEDAARAAARAASRGEPRVVAERAALALAPRGASVHVDISGERVAVVVTSEARLLVGVRVPLRARAEAALEGSGGP